MSDLLERVRAGGLLAPGRPVLVLLSGGRDSVCLLDVAVRIAGDVEALHVNYGLRAEADADEAHCAALCAALGVPLHADRPARAGRQRPGVGARASATRRPRGSRAATSPPATPRPTRSRPCSTGSPPRPGGARCSAWPRATGGWSGRCSA